ncbi:MAG: hypothetical protein MR033_06000 [Clostridiales bacterium]|nr:hypothetical protein [Clostridiales bacterium]
MGGIISWKTMDLIGFMISVVGGFVNRFAGFFRSGPAFFIAVRAELLWVPGVCATEGCMPEK